MIKIVPNFNLKRGIPLILRKKDPFLKNGSGSNVGEKLKMSDEQFFRRRIQCRILVI